MKKLLTLGLAALTSFAIIACDDSNPTGGGGGSSWDSALNGTWDYYGTADQADLSGDPMTKDYFVISDGSWKTQGTEMFTVTVGEYYAQDGVIGYKYSGNDTPMWSYLVEDGVLYWNGSTTDGTIDKTSSDVLVFKKQ